ncbi:MAG TPA: hypothetical protein VK611_09980 [Acidimicrobiales bacterium]|nr:hypothetical protein [Acidimicrobiales bacterium]
MMRPDAGDPVALLIRAVDDIARRTRGRTPVGLSHDEADASAGSFRTDDAIGFDPLPVLRALDTRGAPVVVMGQVAGIMHGSKELTGDLDLLWNGDPALSRALADAFGSLAALVSDGDGKSVPCTAAAFLLPKVLFRTTSASGDCCTPQLPWGGLDILGIIDRAEVAHADGGLTIRYVAKADLVAMRRVAGRPKDRRRAQELAALLDDGDAP